ncbi:hypothetical protein ACFL2U_02680 [Patescibacteria group bacterium]
MEKCFDEGGLSVIEYGWPFAFKETNIGGFAGIYEKPLETKFLLIDVGILFIIFYIIFFVINGIIKKTLRKKSLKNKII